MFFIVNCLARMVSAKYQSYAEGVRFALGLIGNGLGGFFNDPAEQAMQEPDGVGSMLDANTAASKRAQLKQAIDSLTSFAA